MKVSIIAFNNLNKSPYVNTYADFCRDNGIEYEVIYPDRGNIAENVSGVEKAVFWDSSKGKLYNFLHFRKAAIRELKKSKSDFVIVLTTMPAILLSGYLIRNYKGKYLVDVRDYTYENFKPYYAVEKRVMKYAAMRVISSPGFKKFLPPENYTLCHNMNPEYANPGDAKFEKKEDEIIIGYVGTIAYKNQCLNLIKLVEKDERFRFYFYGDEGSDRRISEYLEKNPSDRIKTFGAYKPDEKVAIMKNVDILFNVYGFGNNLVDYALSNKLYDAFYMNIPLLTSPNTSMSEEASDFSYDIDFSKTENLDGLYNWYQSIDAGAFKDYSVKYLKSVTETQNVFCKRLKDFLFEK